MSGQNVSFLLVEDDEIDVEVFRRAMRKQSLDANLRHAKDGGEALQMLRESHSTHCDEQLVFLDLNMPGMNGHEFLAELRADPELRNTIVFVLTSSDHDRDIRMAYERNVAGYFLKSEMESFVTTISHYVNSLRHCSIAQ